jgi:cyclohexanecarboxylate-CoA ligase
MPEMSAHKATAMADHNSWGIHLAAERIAAMRASGAWQEHILTDFIDRHVAQQADATAVVAWTGDDDRQVELTFAKLAAAADRIALGLYALGIRRGDIVSFQLNNRWEFIAIVLACARIGAVSNPLMPILRQRELTFILGLTESKVLIVPNRFRDFDFASMAREVASAVPSLKHVFAIGGEEMSFVAHFLNPAWEEQFDKAVIFASNRPEPNDVTLLMFTSGTTGEPKGVMHTANTLLSGGGLSAELLGLTGSDVIFMPLPLAHMFAYAMGAHMALTLGSKLVLQDHWNPAVATRLIQNERATYSAGTPTFLNDQAHFNGPERDATLTIRLYFCGGAPVPPVLVRDAKSRVGCKVISIWGMTENLLVTGVRPSDPDEKSSETDGAAAPHCEVRVVDDDGVEVPRGTPGRLLARGCTHFVGYFKRPALYNVDPGGWFDTGDLARMDGDDYIRITGRTKDLVIRGGENIPVVEVENLLLEHPAVNAVAIVAMPDARLGERACAFVQLRPGQSLVLGDVRAFLLGKQLAPSYLPERLELLDEMPMTPSGKIQKFVLRERARALV